MIEPFHFEPRGRLIDFMRQAEMPGIINLAAGVPGMDALPAGELHTAFETAFRKRRASVFAYHHPEGDPVLRQLLAERLKQRGARVEGGDVLTTTGCQQGLQLMMTLLVRPGDVVACQVPIYYALLELISAAGARILPIPEHGPDGIDPEELKELVKQWNPKCLFLCPTLSNPSTVTLSNSQREKIVEICRQQKVRIIEDDIYAELVEAGAPKPMRAFDDGSTVSYVSSYSKCIAPGLRAGFCVPGDLFQAAATLKCQQDMHSSVVSESILRTFLEMRYMDGHLARLRPRNALRLEAAVEAVNKSFPADTKVQRPEGGYMIWVELPEGSDVAMLAQNAKERGVVFASGSVFFPGEIPQPTLRLNCSKAEHSDLVQGIHVLGSVLTSQSPS
jgi:DNA-binding transcriptional MocR family regulator